MKVFIFFLILAIQCILFFDIGSSTTVTYNHRALIIDGKKRVLQSGSIHYPRTTPDIWPKIISKAKEGGLDVIESYVFWNYHEPVRGQYNFEGRFDLVNFVKTVQKAGLFVHLRIGPYACAEWNYGGFPVWLHFLPGIQFRTNNEIFKKEMKGFLVKIVNLMKDEKLFASQGGPIILAQVENEYGDVESAYGTGGQEYVKWAAETAVSLNTTVPWVMCMQSDAPDPILNTCNGFYCDGFTPNSKSKPAMWTENYPGWFLSFGYAIPHRPVEDIAFAVARFFEKGGTFQNYYMYFGGTNFGRTAGGPLIATSYDYDAPLDEHGFIREPKWGHLRDLHLAIKHCEDYIVEADPTRISLGVNLEAHVYYKTSDDCAAFLANYDSKKDANVTFKGFSYFLPAWSVSILPDCKNVIFNTAKLIWKFCTTLPEYVNELFAYFNNDKVVAQKTPSDVSIEHNGVLRESLMMSSPWSWYKETVGIWGSNSFVNSSLLEQINTTKDTSDFLWYTTSLNVNEENEHNQTKEVSLVVKSLGHAALVFVNKRVVGFGRGIHDDPSFEISEKIHLNPGNNTLDILSMLIGLQNFGSWFDIAGAGISSVTLTDSKGAKEDLSTTKWTYQVGLKGEFLGLDKPSLFNSSVWETGNSLPMNQSLIWYKSTFLTPDGEAPVSLNLSSMGKGQAWVNGQGIGRYWPAYLAPSTGCTDHCDYRGTQNSNSCLKRCGQPTQTLYYIPRSWLNAGENTLVLHEELGGDPTKISVVTRTGQEICGIVSEADLPPTDTWEKNVGFMSRIPQVRLSCDEGWHIASITFASFGNPKGECGEFIPGSCHINVSSFVQQVCVGNQACSIPVSTADLGGQPCPGVLKSLAIQAICSE